MSSHWLLVIFIFVLIGRCDYFGFGFTTLNRKALYPVDSVIHPSNDRGLLYKATISLSNVSFVERHVIYYSCARITAKVLGSGAFGEVYLAEAEGSIISDNMAVNSHKRHRLSTHKDARRGSTISQGPIKVAVKTLKGKRKLLTSYTKCFLHRVSFAKHLQCGV